MPSIRSSSIAAVLVAAIPVAGPLASADSIASTSSNSASSLWEGSREFFDAHCLSCHDADSREGGLDLIEFLDSISSDASPVTQRGQRLATWVNVFDRIESGEMPPDEALGDESRRAFLHQLRPLIMALESEHLGTDRAVWRRMNRFEYENSIRDLLHAPWLQVAQGLPEDGEAELFNKIGTALDTSHVQVARYLQVTQEALHAVTANREQAIDPAPTRYYARRQPAFNGRLRYNEFNRSPERAVFPLLDHEPDLAVLNDDDAPPTLVDREPERITREAFGVVASSYEPLEIQFDEFKAPESGHYKLRFNAYSFWAGPGEGPKWWRPDRSVTSKGQRNEPVSLYSRSPPRVLRKLTSFDVTPDSDVHEVDVMLLRGESIQVDAARLFRSRPPAWQNPLATEQGQPGVAFKWMEAEGPLHAIWPTAGHAALFADLPTRKVKGDPLVEVVSNDPTSDARRLLVSFLRRAYRDGFDELTPEDSRDVDRFLHIFDVAADAGQNFRDAMFTTYAAVLCSPRFVCLREPTGSLDNAALVSRLSYFLTNSPPDAELRSIAESDTTISDDELRHEADRLLRGETSSRFMDAFTDYWLDLRKSTDTSPDERLYPDYYLDDLLIDSSVLETRRFITELVRENLPIRDLVDSDFVFVNERLAQHYGIENVEGVHLRRIELPSHHLRGGLLTQASILKITANGTTTSPVQRGAWVMERILGLKPPPPPPGVPAIEPDTRGATTVRQQLDLHRNIEACATCHTKIDPAGFAMESFDVLGGWRDRYRALPTEETPSEKSEGEATLTVSYVDPEPGNGKNGQPFRFKLAQRVDASGVLPSGEAFSDVREFKRLLAAQDRQLARNLTSRLITFATAAPVRFGDREHIEAVLDRVENDGYPVRSIILEIVASDLFQKK